MDTFPNSAKVAVHEFLPALRFFSFLITNLSLQRTHVAQLVASGL